MRRLLPVLLVVALSACQPPADPASTLTALSTIASPEPTATPIPSPTITSTPLPSGAVDWFQCGESISASNRSEYGITVDDVSLMGGMALSPDGTFVAVGNYRTVSVCDVATHQHLADDGSMTISNPTGMSWSPDPTVPVTNSAGRLYIMTVTAPDGTIGRLYPGGAGASTWSPDGMLLATAHGDVRIWNASSGNELNTVTNTGSYYQVAWSPDGMMVAGGNVFGSVRIWSPLTGNLLAARVVPENPSVMVLQWSTDGRLLLGTIERRAVFIFDPATQRDVLTLDYGADSAAWSPDGSMIALGNPDGQTGVVSILESASGGELGRIMMPGSATVRGIAWLPDGGRIVTLSGVSDIMIWDIAQVLK